MTYYSPCCRTAAHRRGDPGRRAVGLMSFLSAGAVSFSGCQQGRRLREPAPAGLSDSPGELPGSRSGHACRIGSTPRSRRDASQSEMAVQVGPLAAARLCPLLVLVLGRRSVRSPPHALLLSHVLQSPQWCSPCRGPPPGRNRPGAIEAGYSAAEICRGRSPSPVAPLNRPCS